MSYPHESNMKRVAAIGRHARRSVVAARLTIDKPPKNSNTFAAMSSRESEHV